PGTHDRPLEPARSDHLLLHVLVVIDALEKERKGQCIVEKAAAPPTVARAQPSDRYETADAGRVHRVDEDAGRPGEDRGAGEDHLRRSFLAGAQRVRGNLLQARLREVDGRGTAR